MMNKNFKNVLIFLSVSVLIIASLSSCNSVINSDTNTTTQVDQSISEVSSNEPTEEAMTETEVIETNPPIEYFDIPSYTLNFNDSTPYDDADGFISEDEENVVLKSGANYTLKGTLNNKRIRVVEGNMPEIFITLDGFNVKGSIDSLILIVDNCVASIELADKSSNVIAISDVDQSKYQDTYHNAAIFSRNLINFFGNGSLTIKTDNESSIESEDSVYFISGNYTFNTNGDAVRVKNEVSFKSGNYDITCGDDAIKAKSDTDGHIVVEDASMKINAGDKGFTSDGIVTVYGGDINIDSYGESISGKVVALLGGDINLKSGDDAINSTDGKQDKKSNQRGVYTKIANCNLYIDAVMDGIDSNGDLYLDSGKIFIDGADNNNERIIDYNGIVTYGNMLEFVGVGPSSKMQDLGEDENKNYIIVYYKDPMNVKKASDEIIVKDEDNNLIISHTTKKSYYAVMIASPLLIPGRKYIISTKGKTVEVMLEPGKNEIYDR